MNNQPFLTIGIANYNYSKYLPRAFEAIKRQSFCDFEILYADDGSTDDSVSVIEQFISDNPDMNIRFIQGENAGVMGNKNRILDNAWGEYVMLCDADDWMEDNCLERLCMTAQQTRADQVSAAVRNINEKGRILQIQHIPPKQSVWTWGLFHATIFRMEIIQKHHLRMQSNVFPDDVFFNMSFHRYSTNVIFIDETLYNWFIHSDSASSTKHKKSSWLGSSLLKSSLSYIAPIYQESDLHQRREEIEYMALKLYCLCIYYRNAKTSFSEFLKEYHECKKELTAAFPDYEKNAAWRSLSGRGYVRKRTANIMFMTGELERMHIINGALFAYWALAHVISFSI